MTSPSITPSSLWSSSEWSDDPMFSFSNSNSSTPTSGAEYDEAFFPIRTASANGAKSAKYLFLGKHSSKHQSDSDDECELYQESHLHERCTQSILETINRQFSHLIFDANSIQLTPYRTTSSNSALVQKVTGDYTSAYERQPGRIVEITHRSGLHIIGCASLGGKHRALTTNRLCSDVPELVPTFLYDLLRDRTKIHTPKITRLQPVSEDPRPDWKFSIQSGSQVYTGVLNANLDSCTLYQADRLWKTIPCENFIPSSLTCLADERVRQSLYGRSALRLAGGLNPDVHIELSRNSDGFVAEARIGKRTTHAEFKIHQDYKT